MLPNSSQLEPTEMTPGRNRIEKIPVSSCQLSLKCQNPVPYLGDHACQFIILLISHN